MMLILGTSLLAAGCAKSRGASSNHGTNAAAQFYPAPNQNSFGNLDAELAGRGRWESIGRHRYFVPDAPAILPGGPEWAPVRNGHWEQGPNDQYVWASDDAFGSVTDHRGVWRHHSRFKWVWRNFDDNHYEPNVVTFFENDGELGWSPYRPEFRSSLENDLDDGFDDYFDSDQGYAGIDELPGFTALPRDEFLAPNVIEHITANPRPGFPRRRTGSFRPYGTPTRADRPHQRPPVRSAPREIARPPIPPPPARPIQLRREVAPVPRDLGRNVTPRPDVSPAPPVREPPRTAAHSRRDRPGRETRPGLTPPPFAPGTFRAAPLDDVTSTGPGWTDPVRGPAPTAPAPPPEPAPEREKRFWDWILGR